MKNLFLLSTLILFPFFLSAQIASVSSSSLSHEIAGEYIGTFARNGVVQENVLVTVSPKDEQTVKISTLSGAKMKSFTAQLEDESLSSLRRLRLKTDKKVKMKEGMITPLNGRLSFAISRSNGTLEVFSGLKIAADK